MTALFLSACNTTPIPADQAPLWKHKADIQITTSDKRAWDGMATTDLADTVSVGLVSKVPLDVLMISSCSRNIELEDVNHSWFGGSSKKYQFDYSPAPLEKDGFCPLYFQAFAKGGTVGWGMLTFRTSEALTATLECNGGVEPRLGVSACQAKTGSVQAIDFGKEVKFAASTLCQIKEVKPGRFELTAALGICDVGFSDGTNKHHLLLLGFDDIFLRSNP